MNTITPPEPQRPAPGRRPALPPLPRSGVPARARGAGAVGLPGRSPAAPLAVDDWAALKVRDSVRRACFMAASELLLLARLG
ncbi:hypothetical protein [Aquabacterium sp.]|uniref:hypothetical protein n=1 Tax=Aquabacterium sp. TaxID=1872578 RepID=UPI0037849679